MPQPQDDETTNQLTGSEPSGSKYTDADLEILHEIIALATTIIIPAAAASGGSPASFRTIWKAYDTVLAAHKIDPALDSVYFRFILEMQGAPGDDLKEKFMYMLDVGSSSSSPSFYICLTDGW